jgi:hypothetical protein
MAQIVLGILIRPQSEEMGSGGFGAQAIKLRWRGFLSAGEAGEAAVESHPVHPLGASHGGSGGKIDLEERFAVDHVLVGVAAVPASGGEIATTLKGDFETAFGGRFDLDGRGGVFVRSGDDQGQRQIGEFAFPVAVAPEARGALIDHIPAAGVFAPDGGNVFAVEGEAAGEQGAGFGISYGDGEAHFR